MRRNIQDPLALYNAHTDNFNDSYYFMYENVHQNTHLIMNETYGYIVGVLQKEPLPRNEPMKDRKYWDTSQLHGNVKGAYLYRDGKVVTTKEHVFDVILEFTGNYLMQSV
jgi:hypothetical protein